MPFQSGSKFLQKKWEERSYRVHQQKVHSMKAGLDNSTPKQYPHLMLRLKKIQKEEERQEQIDHDNQLLLHKMTHIMKNKSRVENWNEHEPRKTIHQSYREREQARIQEENAGIARRLGQVRPLYKVTEWEAEYDKHEYYLNLWENSTKDYTLSPRQAGQKHAKSDVEYESDFEEDEGSQKLPKIESRESTRSEKRQRKDPTVTKLPSIKTKNDAVAEQDSKLLFKACKQLTKPEDAIIKALIKRSHKQRMATKAKFEESYDLDLESELKASTESECGPVIEALLTAREDVDADNVNKAIRSNNIAGLVEILCSRNSAALKSINKTYKNKYSLSVEEDVDSSIKDAECRALLLALINPKRPSDGSLNEDQAEDDAQDIYEAGAGCFDAGGVFLSVVKNSSMAHLKAVMSAYTKMSGQSITQVMKDEHCSEDYINAVKSLSSSVSSPGSLYAQKIHLMLESGNLRGLAMILVERSEVDTESIRKAYKKKYGVTLVEDLTNKTSHSAGLLLCQLAVKSPPKGGVGGAGGGGGGGKGGGGKGEGGKGEVGTARGGAGGANKPKDKKSQGGTKPKTQNNSAKKTNAESKDSEPDDVTRLYEAMKGFGTDEQVIIDILTKHSNAERQQLSKKYRDKYKKDFMEELKSELRGDFEEVMVALMYPPTSYDAYCLHEAMSGLGTSEAAHIGILATRTAKELDAIKKQYESVYGSKLEDDLHGDSSGGFQALIMKLVKGERTQGKSVDEDLAKEDAEKLAKDSEASLVDDDDFCEILTSRNKAQLRATFSEYKKISGQSIEDGIRKSMSGDAEDAYISLVQACSDPVEFYARRLDQSMSGLGTNDTMLIRVIVSRSEVDLPEIKAKYTELFGKKLEDQIDSECSGDYRKALLALIKRK